MGVCNGAPFVIRINVGVLADITQLTSRDRKNTFGNASYIISMFESVQKNQGVVYILELDGVKKTIEGVGLTVANSGNVGIQGFSIASNVSLEDGLLDVIIIKSADPGSLLSLAKGVALNEKSPVIDRYKVKNATITINPNQTIVQDDMEIKADKLEISVSPQALHVLL